MLLTGRLTLLLLLFLFCFWVNVDSDNRAGFRTGAGRWVLCNNHLFRTLGHRTDDVDIESCVGNQLICIRNAAS